MVQGIRDPARAISEAVAGAAVSSSPVSLIAEGPSNYSVAWVDTVINDANKDAAEFDILGGVVDDDFAYVITSSGGGTPVTDTGTIAADPEQLTGIDLTGLNDGVLTLEVVITDQLGEEGNPVQDTITKDVVAPAGYSVTITSDPVESGVNDDAFAFDFADAEVGATYAYSIDSDGGPAAPVTGGGTIATATDSITGIDVSSLEDGTLTLTVALTDPAGNVGADATDTVTKSTP